MRRVAMQLEFHEYYYPRCAFISRFESLIMELTQQGILLVGLAGVFIGICDNLEAVRT